MRGRASFLRFRRFRYRGRGMFWIWRHNSIGRNYDCSIICCWLTRRCGGTHGECSTNGFADIFVVTNNPTTGSLTNYLDIGAATNVPSRF